MARAPIIPKQPDRRAQAMVEAHFASERTRNALHDEGRGIAKDSAGSEELAIGIAGNLAVYHGLGRVPTGWRVVKSTAAIDEPLYESASDKTTITIENPGAVAFAGTIEVW